MSKIQENYTVPGMLENIKSALATAGFADGPLLWSDLVPFDQFHVRGLEASAEMAASLHLQGGERVLDVGSGLGGPARYLAAVHAAQVTGIDLTRDYVEIAEYLSARSGLAHLTQFRQGDASKLEDALETYDVIWTQHVSMNVQDKPQFYRGLQPLLKRGAFLASYDVIRGDETQPIEYPTPWARQEHISFVASESEMRADLAAAGLAITSFIDKSEISGQWFKQILSQAPAQPASPLSPLGILGPQMGVAIGNFGKNLLSGRVRIVQVIAQKG